MTEVFDFEAVKGVRWRVVGSGFSMPEGVSTVDLEWENGEEASFSSYTTDLRFWADGWMETHPEDEWCDDQLPGFFFGDEWFRPDNE